jgi:hypothetical protein
MKHQYVIFIDDETWHAASWRDGGIDIRPIPFSDGAPDTARAQSTAKVLVELGHAREAVLLALPSAWCLSAVMSTAELDRSHRRRAMAFRLEEHLPISAEEMVADYIELPGDRALGVSSRTDALEGIVLSLEDAGIPVRQICPVALLAAQRVRQDAPQANAILVAPGPIDSPQTGWDLITMEGDLPTQWLWMTDDPASLRPAVESLAMSAEKPVQLAVIGDANDTESLIDESPGVERLTYDTEYESITSAATEQAGFILEGDQAPWIDLRRDALAAPGGGHLYRGPVRMLVAAVVLLLVALSVVVYHRGLRYGQLNESYETEQAALFRKTLNQAPPAGSVRRRMLSERASLAGLGGQASGEPGEQSPSALSHLLEILAHLPDGIRYRILDLRIQPNLIRIDGQAKSHVEAERIAVALRQSGRFQVEPPKTQAMTEKGVSFLLAAKPRQEVSP